MLFRQIIVGTNTQCGQNTVSEYYSRWHIYLRALKAEIVFLIQINSCRLTKDMKLGSNEDSDCDVELGGSSSRIYNTLLSKDDKLHHPKSSGAVDSYSGNHEIFRYSSRNSIQR